jgi:hypothetical protein
MATFTPLEFLFYIPSPELIESKQISTPNTYVLDSIFDFSYVS